MNTQPGQTTQNAFSPSALNQILKKHLNEQFGSFWLTGEIFELYQSPAGHKYFTLKDSQSGIKCVMFKQKQNTPLAKGSQVIILGNLSLYTPKGDLQVNVLRIMDAGKGDLAQQFMLLKQKLQQAGLFEQKNKQQLPSMIGSLAIVTSPKGAALQDILNIIKSQNPLIEITLYPTPVQGEDAAPKINHALRVADEANHDAILLTRGGGSKEDLWTFNDEFLAHQIAQLETPVISAVGHETDESISDLVADVTCITPSAAAQLISGDFRQSKHLLTQQKQLLSLLVQDKLRLFQQQVDSRGHAIEKRHPSNLLKQQEAALGTAEQKLNNSFSSKWLALKNNYQHLHTALINNEPDLIIQHQRLKQFRQQLSNNIKSQLSDSHQALQLSINDLNHQNPLNVLARGFSITSRKQDNKVITDISQVKDGDEVVTQLKSGRISAKIFERLEK
ncbi:exodeoxyribonuclease VII large subunit [Marinicella sp. S1101]|uniref:exodeoxyribonuclease VII large subunit n=1 Tax=Marinicella marina TaxID=2996016 RepID=UPI0022609929|nr:exodeoxyribonuclease VII large subunit [Marinicella marina]MCX7553545.1 exodeoxyribonuclease VII large subunit [Marinicella marina]MDJ1140169.1 exodeoxyribonuclease VII large subunit [Marinicella marina]